MKSKRKNNRDSRRSAGPVPAWRRGRGDFYFETKSVQRKGIASAVETRCIVYRIFGGARHLGFVKYSNSHYSILFDSGTAKKVNGRIKCI